MTSSASPKTCVILVHGMGEQKPMETLWSFVKTVWIRDPFLRDRNLTKVFSKPDAASGSFELRRITTLSTPTDNGESRRVDFFEFYWAHLMRRNTLRQMVRWLRQLLSRHPKDVPARLFVLWIAALLPIIVASVILGLSILDDNLEKILRPYVWQDMAGKIAIAIKLLATALGYFITRTLVPILGDAARYLSPGPDHIETRQKIREAGIDLLRQLSDRKDYDRIVMVGHSLGSVIAYDILTHAWSRIDKKKLETIHAPNSDPMQALDALENAAANLADAATNETPNKGIEQERTAYRDAQNAYASALAKSQSSVWLVSDFITLGSPLSKADILLTTSPEEFEDRKDRRELPTCPPVFEPHHGRLFFSYPQSANTRIPHHAAVFGPTRWTNIYFDHAILLGDPISGPVAPWFGPGVKDLGHRDFRTMRHTHYWTEPDDKPTPPWVTDLRKALSLKRVP